MLEGTKHPCVVYQLKPEEVPDLAASVQRHESEPFGGMPTLAYARLFDRARADGVTVVHGRAGYGRAVGGLRLLRETDQWRFARIADREPSSAPRARRVLRLTFAICQAVPAPTPFPDALRNRQYADTRFTKMPKALRFNDRISMRSSIELREPFLDHRLFELAFRQPRERKIENGTRKKLLRDVARRLVTARRRGSQAPGADSPA